MESKTTAVPSKRKPRKAVPVNVRVWVSIAEEMDQHIEKKNTNRSEFVREAIIEKLLKAAA